MEHKTVTSPVHFQSKKLVNSLFIPTDKCPNTQQGSTLVGHKTLRTGTPRKQIPMTSKFIPKYLCPTDPEVQAHQQTQSNCEGADRKALVVGQSRCQLAHKMKLLWFARDTADEDGQQGEEAHTTPTIEDARTAYNIILQPLLDGRQGKLVTTDHPHGVGEPCTGMVYGNEDKGELGKEDKLDGSNTTGGADTERKDLHPINQGN
jgi:hypothetical protein